MNRALLLRVHRYAGVALAPFLLLQAATGALLLWHAAAARLIDPAGMASRHAGRAIGPGGAVARAERAVSGGKVARLTWPGSRDGVVLAQLAAPDRTVYVSIDPAGGAVLRVGTIAAFPLEAALALHYRLSTGRIGMLVVLLDALALLALAGSGVAFWWPRRAPRWRQLTIRWNVAGRLVLRQAHRSLGVATSAVLAFSAVTGLLLIVPDLPAGAEPPPVRAAVDAATVDRAVALARAALPGAAVHDLRISSAAIVVNFYAPEHGARALHRVTVPLHGAGSPVVLRAGDDPALWPTVLPLHAGDAGGNVGRLVLLLGALALAALAVSGPLMWWQANATRRRATAARRQPA